MTAKTALCVRTALAFAWILPGSLLQSATVTLIPSGDTSIFQTDPNNNVGGSTSLASGGTAQMGPVRMMFRFDVAGHIPAGATIQDARLDVTVVASPSSARSSTFGIHPLFVDWGEGTGGRGSLTGTGRQATSDEATWMNRFHPSTPWGQAGGQAGIDFQLNSSATASVNAGLSTFGPTPAMIQDLQRWLNDPVSNHGWIAISESESTTRTARRFGSKEHGTIASRPTLTIQYDLFRIESVESSAEGFEFLFQGQEGTSYQAQQRDNLGSEDWSVLTNIGPLTVDGPVRVSDSWSDSSRFYRIKRLPRIVSQPQSQNVPPGQSASFSVVASGSPQLTYQWRRDGVDIEGATNANLLVAEVTEADIGEYSVVVTDGPDSIVSDLASLMFLVAPFIVEHPQNTTNTIGSTATFTVVVTNTATLPIRYIWRKNFTIPIATNELFSRTDTLTITNVQPSDAGGYRVFPSNPASSSISQEGRLMVVE